MYCSIRVTVAVSIRLGAAVVISYFIRNVEAYSSELFSEKVVPFNYVKIVNKLFVQMHASCDVCFKKVRKSNYVLYGAFLKIVDCILTAA